MLRKIAGDLHKLNALLLRIQRLAGVTAFALMLYLGLVAQVIIMGKAVLDYFGRILGVSG